MGWTYTHRSPDTSLRDFFESKIRPCEVVDFAVVALKTAYVAAKQQDGTVIALVILLNYAPKDWYNQGYKDMDEAMGPGEARCPERLLKLLSPLDECYTPGTHSHEWAGKWRAECWEHVNRRKAQPKVKDGDRVVFAHPIKFTNGQELQEFIYRRIGKADRFADPRFATYRPNFYCIGGWRERSYTVL